MSFWQRFSDAIFTGERSWAWRRRITFAGCIVALASVAKAVWWESDKAWAAVLLAQSWAAFGATMALYVAAAGYDDHQKRKLGDDGPPAG